MSVSEQEVQKAMSPEMLDRFGEIEAQIEGKAPEVPTVEPPAEAPPEIQEAPVKEAAPAPEGEVQKADAAPTPPSVQEAAPPPATDELSLVREQNRLLMEQLKELAKRINAVPAPTPEPQVPPEYQRTLEQGEQRLKEGQKLDPIPFVTDDDLPRYFENAAGLNELLSRVYYSAKMDTIRTIMPVIQQQTAQQNVLYNAGVEFMHANPDLQPHEDYLVAVLNTLRSQHPELTLRELLPKVAEETRKRLGLKKAAQESPAPTPKAETRPAFVNSGRPQVNPHGGGPQLTQLQKELYEMRNSLL